MDEDPDDYPERLLDLTDAAYRLHHAATTSCNRLLTDGDLLLRHQRRALGTDKEPTVPGGLDPSTL